MTHVEKELLATDLSGRLNYEPYIKIEGCADVFLTCIYYEYEDYGTKNYYVNNGYDISRVKPYLLPLSSMNKEQKKYIRDNYTFGATYELFDWFDKNHYDYRGLIQKGLAIDATDLNIY